MKFTPCLKKIYGGSAECRAMKDGQTCPKRVYEYGHDTRIIFASKIPATMDVLTSSLMKNVARCDTYDEV